MQTGALTGYIDVAQVVLYAFWVFFAGLLFYLRQEDRREGYPLEAASDGSFNKDQFVFMPSPKTFVLPHDGGTVQAPNDKRDTRPINATPISSSVGAPLEPNTKNPLLAAVGPGSYAERADHVDVTMDGHAKIVPMRKTLHPYTIAKGDPEIVGMKVLGADMKVAGTIVEGWVDQSEQVLRYFEVDLGNGKRPVLVPVNFSIVNGKDRTIYVHALLAGQFADVPLTKSPDQVTLLEEDKIMGYFGGGLLYAKPSRTEPLL